MPNITQCWYRSDLEKINGFDEDYNRTGVGEDQDIEWRLLVSGVKLRSLIFRAVQYHLSHKRNNDIEAGRIGEEMKRKKAAAGKFFCDNGLMKK